MEKIYSDGIKNKIFEGENLVTDFKKQKVLKIITKLFSSIEENFCKILKNLNRNEIFKGPNSLEFLVVKSLEETGIFQKNEKTNSIINGILEILIMKIDIFLEKLLLMKS